MDKGTLLRYLNENNIECAERAIRREKSFGEIMGRMYDALLMSQPGAEDNYGRKNNCLPYLFKGSQTFISNSPEHDVVLKYNQKDPEQQEVSIALINAEKRAWYKVMPGWDEAPDVLKRDTKKIMGLLELTLKD